MANLTLVGKLKFIFLDANTIRVINSDNDSQVIINKNRVCLRKSYHEAEIYINGMSVFVPNEVDNYFSRCTDLINSHFFSKNGTNSEDGGQSIKCRVFGKLRFEFLDKDSIRIISLSNESQVVVNRNDFNISKSYHEAEIYINDLPIFVPNEVDRYFYFCRDIIDAHFFGGGIDNFQEKICLHENEFKRQPPQSASYRLSRIEIVGAILVLCTLILAGFSKLS